METNQKAFEASVILQMDEIDKRFQGVHALKNVILNFIKAKSTLW